MTHSNKEIDKFLMDIKSVCLAHNMSIGHEDTHGTFVIHNYSNYTMQWLFEADDRR